MNSEEHNDPVWDLLKKARETKAGPSFISSVVGKINDGEQERKVVDGGFFSLKTLRAVAAVIAFAAVVSVVVLSQSGSDGKGELAESGKVEESQPAEAVSGDVLTAIDGNIGDTIGELEYVDDLLAVQDPILLSDADIAMLLF